MAEWGKGTELYAEMLRRARVAVETGGRVGVRTVLYCIPHLLVIQIPHLRPAEYKRSRFSRNHRTVNRPYGGVLSGIAVRDRLSSSPTAVRWMA